MGKEGSKEERKGGRAEGRRQEDGRVQGSTKDIGRGRIVLKEKMS